MQNLFKNSIFVYLGLILIIFLGYFFFISAPSGFKEGSIVTIDQGKSLRSLSATLKKENIIRSRVVFESFVIIYEGEKHISIGDYLLEKKLPVFEIARRVSKGDHRLPPVKVTIPEGFTNSDIAEAVSLKLKNFNQANFLEKIKTKEGYLFPDTYFFLTTNNEENVFKSMTENYEKKVAPLRSGMGSMGKTEKEIITMASILEGEANGDADREVISGILWARIAKGMPLQVDIAPITYKVKGLPQAPISNPGLEAIRAAMYPKSSPYLFYLHDNDGTIYYARNFQEHKANIAKYLK